MTLTLEQVAGWLLKQDAELNGRVTVGAIDANLDRCGACTTITAHPAANASASAAQPAPDTMTSR